MSIAARTNGRPVAVARSRKPVTVAPVRPNLGHEAAYLAALERMVDAMQKSITYWLRAAYRSKPPEMAADELVVPAGSSAMVMRKAMARMSRRWQQRIDDAAPELAKWFAMTAADRSDKALQSIMRKAGISVRFKMTAPMNDVMQATIGEQVGLIKSIASRYLSEVEGRVMRSVAAGRDVKGLMEELEEQYGITKRRAALIARDQNNKATASMNRVRQTSLGIKKAVWVHSAAGRNPRPSHVKAGADKVVYDVDKGWFDPAIGKWIWPGTEINCRCVSRPIIPGFES